MKGSMEVLAACHIHSVWSYDGSWTLEALSAKFGERGMRVLMMTEHDRGFDEDRFQRFREACHKASSEKILLVPGIEYSDAANRIHVLVWGLSSFLGEALPTIDMLDRVSANGGVSVLAHPSRRKAWEVFEPRWAERLLGIEAWNRKYDGWAPSKTAPALLEFGNPVPFVGLDFHSDRQSFPLAMALEMRAELTEANVVQCLKSRSCDARAFGFPLTDSIVRTSLPALTAAENARRTAASIFRSAKGLGVRA